MGLEKLIQKKGLLIVCGAGGVGKTTLASALALKGAEGGKKSVVITVDPAKRLASILGLKPPCPDPKLVWKGKGELSACLLEAKETFDGLIQRYARPDIKETILNNPLYIQTSLMLAGTQEYMAMEKLYHLSAEEKFDLIVVDTPPSKNAIDFLKAPLRLIHMINDSLLRFLIAPTLKMGNLGSKALSALSHLSGKEILEDIAKLMHFSLELLGGFTKRSDAIQTLLQSKRCAFVLVCDRFRTLRKEGQTFRADLLRLGFELEGILVNRMPPSFGNPDAIQESIEWAKKQKEPLWQEASRLLKQNLALHSHLKEGLKTLIESVPYYGLVPEIPEGVADLPSLHKIGELL